MPLLSQCCVIVKMIIKLWSLSECFPGEYIYMYISYTCTPYVDVYNMYIQFTELDHEARDLSRKTGLAHNWSTHAATAGHVWLLQRSLP